jgi:hypothetical protein
MLSSDTDCKLYVGDAKEGSVYLATHVDNYETSGADSNMDVVEAKLVSTFAVKRKAPDAPFVGL